MTKQKEKDLKLIKKKKMWPTITIFTLSTLLCILLSIVSMAAFVFYVFSSKLEQSNKQADTLHKTIIKEYESSHDMKQACDKANQVTHGEFTFAVIDSNNNYLGGNGEQTYKLDTGVDFESGATDSMLLYQDEATQEDWILGNDSSIINYFQTVMNAFYHDDEYIDGNDEGKPTFEERLKKTDIVLWTSKYVEEGNYTILVKTVIAMNKNDLAFIGLIIGVGIVAIIVPFVILFVSMIRMILGQRRMTKLVYLDAITGGRNWLYFKHRTSKILMQHTNAKNAFIVVDFLLNKYRNYCSCHGVKKGEELLRKIDDVLSTELEGKLQLATHYANASFSVLIQCEDVDAGIRKIEELIEKIKLEVGSEVLTFHAGVYYVEVLLDENKIPVRRKEVDVDTLYNNACVARRTSTNAEGTDIIVFNEKMLEEERWKHKVENNMAKAIENEEFAVYIQPKYHPSTNELKGAEALVRWIHPEDGLIAPYKFIPIFEENGFITTLDDYMISHVAKLQAEWLAEGKKVVPISVNVSRAHFMDPNLAAHICSLVDAYNTPHNLLEIELTESAFFDDKNALLTTVNRLKEYGFEVSMDDFGAGYSSLNSLKDLPLDVLKLDADFFRGDHAGDRGKIVVSEAISLAKQLNMRIVAEGIEEKEQVDFLASLGCDMIQGYYFAKPMPVDEYEKKAFE